ncbi:MAG: hypothetical protein WC276_07170 [Sedimentibacter sp.]
MKKESLEGNDFFWELVKLMPETAHFIKENGNTVDVLVKQLKIFLISLKKQYKNKRNCINV